MKGLVTGSAGFIGGYVVQELLQRGYEVVGLDNLSKYGQVGHAHDDNPSFTFVEGDAETRDPRSAAPRVRPPRSGCRDDRGSRTFTSTPTT